MFDSENIITGWAERTKIIKAETVNKVISSYFDKLPDSDDTESSKVCSAKYTAKETLIEELSSPRWIQAIDPDFPEDIDKRKTIKFSIRSILSEFEFPSPVCTKELSHLNIGIVAAIGAVFGMVVLTPITRFILGMEDVGIFVGAPLGAFILVISAFWTAKSEKIRKIILASLGLASLVELYRFLSGGGIFGRLWRKIGGRSSGLKRLAAYLAILVFYMITKPKDVLKKEDIETQIRGNIELSIDAAIPKIWINMHCNKTFAVKKSQVDLTKILEQVVGLKNIPNEHIDAGIDELLITIRNMGVVVDKKKGDTFDWNERYQERYKVFGAAEQGDCVIIEEEAIIVNGSVEKKGLVRKVR